MQEPVAVLGCTRNTGLHITCHVCTCAGATALWHNCVATQQPAPAALPLCAGAREHIQHPLHVSACTHDAHHLCSLMQGQLQHLRTSPYACACATLLTSPEAPTTSTATCTDPTPWGPSCSTNIMLCTITHPAAAAATAPAALAPAQCAARGARCAHHGSWAGRRAAPPPAQWCPAGLGWQGSTSLAAPSRALAGQSPAARPAAPLARPR